MQGVFQFGGEPKAGALRLTSGDLTECHCPGWPLRGMFAPALSQVSQLYLPRKGYGSLCLCGHSLSSVKWVQMRKKN